MSEREAGAGSQPLGRAALRRRLESVLPAGARGWHALSATARALDRVEAETAVDPEARREVLTEAYGAAWEAILLRLRRDFGGLPEEDLEEIIQVVWLEIDGIYRRCEDRGRFSGYLWTTLRRRALRRVEAREREREVTEEREAIEEREAPGRGAARQQRALEAQALRRYAWFHWGSQDNPLSRSRRSWSHRQGRAAMVEFAALSCGLEGRPYGELVFWNQPRTGAWGQGEGEGDEKWWRNRATYARGKLKRSLQTPEGRASYERILEQLQWDR